MSQTQQLINLAGPCRVPVSENIDDTSILHGVADNFDHEENTESGIGGSHDTILTLFQKGNVVEVGKYLRTETLIETGIVKLLFYFDIDFTSE